MKNLFKSLIKGAKNLVKAVVDKSKQLLNQIKSHFDKYETVVDETEDYTVDDFRDPEIYFDEEFNFSIDDVINEIKRKYQQEENENLIEENVSIQDIQDVSEEFTKEDLENDLS